jgi:hypothetical protein
MLLTGNLADMLMAGDNSNYAYRVDEYMNREEDPMTEDEAKTAAAVDLFLKEPVEAGIKSGAIAAVMSIPGTAGAIRSAETLGGRAAQTDEQAAFETLRAMEEGPTGVKANVSEGMSLMERINIRLRQESGMANYEAFSTDAANNALMDYLSGKANAKTAAEAFGSIANEAISSGKLTTVEIAELNALMNKTQVYVDAMGLLGDNGINGTGVVSGKIGKLIGSTEALTAAEKKVVDDLISQGREIEIIKRSNIQGQKSFDFKVDGVSTELKTIGNLNTGTGAKRIYEGFQQGADTVIIDGRDAGLTTHLAQEILQRAAGKYPDKMVPGTVQVWTSEGIIIYP